MERRPIVAIVGRPNVGKSTFVNRLVGKRQSIVDDFYGLTRDRIYGEAEWNTRRFKIIDTGGIEIENTDKAFVEVTKRDISVVEISKIFDRSNRITGATTITFDNNLVEGDLLRLNGDFVSLLVGNDISFVSLELSGSDTQISLKDKFCHMMLMVLFQ